MQWHDGDYDINCTVDAANDDALNELTDLNECGFTKPVHVLEPQVGSSTVNDDATARQSNQQI